jgi:hypothetical protein
MLNITRFLARKLAVENLALISVSWLQLAALARACQALRGYSASPWPDSQNSTKVRLAMMRTSRSPFLPIWEQRAGLSRVGQTGPLTPHRLPPHHAWVQGLRATGASRRPPPTRSRHSRQAGQRPAGQRCCSQTAPALEQKHQPGDAHFSGGVELQLGCLHEGAPSGCLTMKLGVDLRLAPFILSC